MLSLMRRFSLRRELQHRCQSTQPVEKWDLLSAVSLERLPVLTRELKDVENRFMTLLNQIEDERSHKSNFELRVAADELRAKELQKKVDQDLDLQNQQTSQDYLDSCTEELNSFQFAKRIGSAEVENNVKSLERAKDRRLVLLVKDQVVGAKALWTLPQGKHSVGEASLRATAQRVLADSCGPDLRVKWLGNAPVGFYKYKYPKSVRKETVGAKIFFFKAQLLDGAVDPTKCADHAWATRTELSALHEDYRKSVNMFLIDEEH